MISLPQRRGGGAEKKIARRRKQLNRFMMVDQAMKNLSTPFYSSEELKGPLSFCEGPDSGFFITDEIGHQIVRIDPDGKLLWKTGEFGNKNGQFHYPTDCAWDGERLYITDRYNHRIVCLDEQGKTIFSFGKHGKSNAEFNEPYGIAVDPHGRLFISDSDNQKIKVFSSDGVFQFSFGVPGPGQEYYESRIFKEQSVYKKWRDDQSRFHTIESHFFTSAFPLGNLDHPKGLALEKDLVAVADYGGRVQIFDLTGNCRHSHYQKQAEAVSLFSFCQWTAFFMGEIYFTTELSPAILKISSDDPELFFESEHEIGKFLFRKDGTIFHLSPFEKTIFQVSI
ncbi:MAG: NHL repeat-containing protein [Candidatus Aureabacteria bacterium]|nr:NHL repeat-containing protein [Candidatus Auribacterota bacterium]